MARVEGIEPSSSGLEAVMLPLHHTRIFIIPLFGALAGNRTQSLRFAGDSSSNQARVQFW